MLFELAIAPTLSVLFIVTPICCPVGHLSNLSNWTVNLPLVMMIYIPLFPMLHPRFNAFHGIIATCNVLYSSRQVPIHLHLVSLRLHQSSFDSCSSSSLSNKNINSSLYPHDLLLTSFFIDLQVYLMVLNNLY